MRVSARLQLSPAGGYAATYIAPRNGILGRESEKFEARALRNSRCNLSTTRFLGFFRNRATRAPAAALPPVKRGLKGGTTSTTYFYRDFSRDTLEMDYLYVSHLEIISAENWRETLLSAIWSRTCHDTRCARRRNSSLFGLTRVYGSQAA